MRQTSQMETGVAKKLWIAAGMVALALGLIGVVLPLVPTAPFVLLAAYCFSRGSKRWEDWLLGRPRLGPMIRNWRAYRIVPLAAKWMATITMSLSGVASWFYLPDAYRWIPALVLLPVAIWLWILPSRMPVQGR